MCETFSFVKSTQASSDDIQAKEHLAAGHQRYKRQPALQVVLTSMPDKTNKNVASRLNFTLAVTVSGRVNVARARSIKAIILSKLEPLQSPSLLSRVKLTLQRPKSRWPLS